MKLDLKNVAVVSRSGLRRLLGAFGLGLVAVTAQGHPGHGLGDADASHVLTSPYHLAVVAGALLVLALTLFAGAKAAQRSLARRVLRLTAGCAALAALATALVWR